MSKETPHSSGSPLVGKIRKQISWPGPGWQFVEAHSDGSSSWAYAPMPETPPDPRQQLHDLLDGATAEERKQHPLYSGGMAYFRDAWLRIARVSYDGNRQHNGEGHPLQWTRGKSSDHKDCVARHLATGDEEEHLASMAWRACADLQIFLEQKYNIKPPPGCKMNPPPKIRPGYSFIV